MSLRTAFKVLSTSPRLEREGPDLPDRLEKNTMCPISNLLYKMGHYFLDRQYDKEGNIKKYQMSLYRYYIIFFTKPDVNYTRHNVIRYK